MAGAAIVLDANILIRFAIGRQVPRLLAAYAATVDFLAPETAFDEARRNLPRSSARVGTQALAKPPRLLR